MILGTMSNDIYMQIALIMLMGLLAKNAILIVEFALDRRKQGMSISWAAVLGAAARLRPILMTSLFFYRKNQCFTFGFQGYGLLFHTLPPFDLYSSLIRSRSFFKSSICSSLLLLQF